MAGSPAENSDEGPVSGSREMLVQPDESPNVTVVLFHGKPPEAGMEWNTAVWTGWGSPDEVTLRWAANGVRVKKPCDIPCVVSKDVSLIPQADAVLFEVI